MSLDPYTAVLLASYGGPNESADVLPFMRNATRGKSIPDERLLEVSQHYELFGGRSPINELNAALATALTTELAARGIDVPVVMGNRNWTPYFSETVEELTAAGHRRVLSLATSAYQSYSSCRQYCEDLDRATLGTELRVDKIDPFWWTTQFHEANARALVTAVRSLRERIGDAPLRVLFVTHSIPMAMNEASAAGAPQPRYDAQHLLVASTVAALAGAELGEDLIWELTFCSRSGAPHVAWLEPDVNDRMPQVQADGAAGVVAAPIGFISDHMEVAFDLDTQANETASGLDLPYQRAATVGTDPGFVAMLVDQLIEHATVLKADADAVSRCRYASGTCCLPRPATKDGAKP